MQRNWIGRSTGANVEFELCSGDGSLMVFTTRLDTIFGVSFVAVSPSHPLAQTSAPPSSEHESWMTEHSVRKSDKSRW